MQNRTEFPPFPLMKLSSYREIFEHCLRVNWTFTFFALQIILHSELVCLLTLEGIGLLERLLKALAQLFFIC